jgi:hypothetical protein
MTTVLATRSAWLSLAACTLKNIFRHMGCKEPGIGQYSTSISRSQRSRVPRHDISLANQNDPARQNIVLAIGL